MIHLRLFVGLTLVAAAVAAPAAAAEGHLEVWEVVIAAGPAAFFANYATPIVTVVDGHDALFVNGDVPPHNVVADGHRAPDDRPWCAGMPKGKCPLFRSTTVGPGGKAPVLGLDEAGPGTYGFVCTLHPETMRGTLTIVPVPDALRVAVTWG